jgi:hypothetical protein
MKSSSRRAIRSLVGVEDLEHQNFVRSHARGIIPRVCRIALGGKRLVALGHLICRVATIVSRGTGVDRNKILLGHRLHVAQCQGVSADRLDRTPDIDNAPAALAEPSDFLGRKGFIKQLLRAERALIDVGEVRRSNLADTSVIGDLLLLDLLGDGLPGCATDDVRKDPDISGSGTADEDQRLRRGFRRDYRRSFS